MKNLKKLPFILSILSFLTLFTSANAEIKVVASIKPIHSLASYLMEGAGSPDLIVDGYASPHGFALKPSHAKMLQEADIIFYVGEGLENFLEKPLKSIAKKAEKIELMEIKGLNKLKFRERNIFDDHDDHGHKEDDHDDHAKKEDDHGSSCYTKEKCPSSNASAKKSMTMRSHKSWIGIGANLGDPQIQVLKAIGVRGVVVHLGRERHRQREEGQNWNREKRDRARREREADFQHRSTSCGCGQATDGSGLQVEIGVPA